MTNRFGIGYVRSGVDTRNHNLTRTDVEDFKPIAATTIYQALIYTLSVSSTETREVVLYDADAMRVGATWLPWIQINYTSYPHPNVFNTLKER